MGDMISQAEIDALLGNVGGGAEPDSSGGAHQVVDTLTSEQKDILGEVGNISMGTSATTLSALLNQKVWITTPKVSTISWHELADSYNRPCVGIRVDYKEGVIGTNILILKQDDVKIISNLMFGGDGKIDVSEPLSEIDLSAISEAMNQMVGSSSTSLSSLIKKKIDIDTPNAFILDFDDDDFFENIGFGEDGIVATKFRMEIGTLIDSEIIQILPKEFAGDMVEMMKAGMMGGLSEPSPTPTPAAAPVAPPTPQVSQQMQMDYQQPQMQQPYPQQPQMQMPPYPQPQYQQPQMPYPDPNMGYTYGQMPPQASYPPPQAQPQYQPPPVNVQQVQFQNFDVNAVIQQKENIGIIMDVPLEVTVELGRTSKKIKEILEFSPGTIIELDKLAGEPIDILVNGKFVAKGEVVVIDENFGIRITDIISVENRI